MVSEVSLQKGAATVRLCPHNEVFPRWVPNSFTLILAVWLCFFDAIVDNFDACRLVFVGIRYIIDADRAIRS